jgi:hypothetical protein
LSATGGKRQPRPFEDRVICLGARPRAISAATSTVSTTALKGDRTTALSVRTPTARPCRSAQDELAGPCFPLFPLTYPGCTFSACGTIRRIAPLRELRYADHMTTMD